jgi:hypothetical protein
MRHGYYIACTDSMHGDEEFSQDAKNTFNRFGFTPDKKGRYQGGRYDGCSLFIGDDGFIVERVCLEDFFSEQFRVIVKDDAFNN